MKVQVFIIIAVGILIVGLPIFMKTTRSGEPPTASFTYSPSIPGPGDIITFDASASLAPGGSIASYSWDFGDGVVTATSNAIITHSYPLDGNYTVQLTVTDNGGLTGTAAAVIQVQKDVSFRVCFANTIIPLPNVQVTVYYNNGTAWAKAPAGSRNPGVYVEYDNMTQPKEIIQYRNPGFTASILLNNGTNIEFDIHPSSMTVFFKIQWGSQTAYWPNDTNTYYTYDKKHGTAVAQSFEPGGKPYWDPSASAYVIRASHIKGGECSESSPIVVGILCPPPTQQWSLNVKTDPLGITTIPGQGLYGNGTNVVLTAPTYVGVSTSSQYRFNYWDVDGTSRGSGVNPITVLMTANHTATAHYVLQYSVVFNQAGLSSGATGTVTTVNGIPETLAQLPYTLWVDNGGPVTYSFTSTVLSSVSGKQFRLNSVSGPSSPITVIGATTVTGNYVAQYQVTFAQTGLDSTASGTIVTVNGNTKGFADLSYSLWVDSGSSVAYSYGSTVSSSTTGKQFRLNSVTGPASPITISSAITITGNYVTQFLVTFAQTGLDPSATGTAVTINGNPKTYADLPSTIWVDSGLSVTYSYSNVPSSTVGKRFILTGVGGPSSPTTVTGPVAITGSYKTQYRVTFDQSGVGGDFAGTVVTVDSANFTVANLPFQFWWDQGSSHNFAFASPLTVNSSIQYAWSFTSGLSTLQSGTLTISTSGVVTGSYTIQNSVTFDQSGASSDFTGTVVIIDGTPYTVNALPLSFYWQLGSTHSFAFQSPLVVTANSKQYVWTGTTGLSTSQSQSITITTFGSIVGQYKGQYYLTVATNPSGLDSPSGSGWYDIGTYASISTDQYVPGISRWRFANWTTTDMHEIVSPSSPSTTVLVDIAKTVTANYVNQYLVTFSQTGLTSDFTGTIVILDGDGYNYTALPVSFWWDSSSSHTFAFQSPLFVNASEQYKWTSTSGLSVLQGGTITILGPGSVTGNYVLENKYQITFSQTGVNTDFAGTVAIIDGNNYDATALPSSFWWEAGSTHTFAYQSPLVVNPSTEQYVWVSTAGLSTLQSDTVTVTASGSIIGNYKSQYYLTMATSPPGVASPSGAGWYDAGTNATISTPAFVDITPGSSRYRFNGWTTGNMTEITDATRSPTTVLMDEAKTVTAAYVVQYFVTFDQAGVGSDFTSTIVTVDVGQYNVTGLPYQAWWDAASVHTFAYQSPLIVTQYAKQYVWTSTTGLSSSQTGSLTVAASGSVTGNFKTQYYLTVNSLYDSPTPVSGWQDAGTPITASVTSPAPGLTGIQYVCTGWTGAGDVPSSGTGASVGFPITQPSSITWNWKTQYYLTVKTNPDGIAVIAGEGWYEGMTPMSLTAPTVQGYNFGYWDVDGPSQGNGVNPISVTMDAPHTATAHYYNSSGPVTVAISPTIVTIPLGSSVTFASTVSGGSPPYSYQWYLGNTAVPGATSDSWTFTPSSRGTFFIYLGITDANNNTASSTFARVTVVSTAIGGYSVSFAKPTPTTPTVAYFGIVVFFGLALIFTKRKRK